jgi:hypothetical protein
VQDCQVCGRRFDALGFQVVVPELARGFDRVECAQSARTLAPPENRIAAAPLVALVEPVGPAPAARARTPLRPLATPVATLGLLAAGTAAAALLWVHALDTEPAPFDFARAATPPATAQETVEAHVQPVPVTGSGPIAGVLRERTAPVSVPAVPVAVREPSDGSTARPARRDSGRSRHPLARPTASAKPTSAAKTTGKDHVKRGKGHYKHGESNGIHTAGHGGANGGGHGHGKGHGKH